MLAGLPDSSLGLLGRGLFSQDMPLSLLAPPPAPGNDAFPSDVCCLSVDSGVGVVVVVDQITVVSVAIISIIISIILICN